MCTELQIFLLGIKPALLCSKKNIEKIKTDEFIVIEKCNDDILIIRDAIQLESKSLGIILGYYPKSVEAFWELKKQDKLWNSTIYINYNGIFFNTAGLFEEALEWCNITYGEKVKKAFGTIDVRKVIPYRNENGKVLLKSEKIIVNL